MLIGEAADDRVLDRIRDVAKVNSGIDAIGDPLTLYFGPHDIMLALSVRFREDLDASSLARTIDDMERAIRVAVPDGAPEFLGKAAVHLPPFPGGGRPNEGSWLNFVTGLVVGKEMAYIGTQTDGIYAYPLSGGPARRIGIKQALPGEGITALALLNEKLYAGLTNGYIISFFVGLDK